MVIYYEIACDHHVVDYVSYNMVFRPSHQRYSMVIKSSWLNIKQNNYSVLRIFARLSRLGLCNIEVKSAKCELYNKLAILNYKFDGLFVSGTVA